MLTRRRLALVGLLALFVTGCGPAYKQAAVREVRSAADQVGVRTGTVTMTVQPFTGVPTGRTAVLSGGALPALAGVVLDPAHHSAALIAPAGMPAKFRGQPVAVFMRSLVYGRTADGPVIGARPWLRVDSNHLGGLNHYTVQDLLRPATLGDLAVLNPLTIIDQLRGLLTGSVRVDHRATVTLPSSGIPVPAVEISGNTSLDKVARQLHLDPDSERPTRNLLGIYAITQDVNPISVWLSPTGTLLRVRVSFVAKPQPRVRFGVVYDLTLDPPQTSTTILAALTLPKADDVVDINSLGQLSLALTSLGRPGAAS